MLLHILENYETKLKISFSKLNLNNKGPFPLAEMGGNGLPAKLFVHFWLTVLFLGRHPPISVDIRLFPQKDQKEP